MKKPAAARMKKKPAAATWIRPPPSFAPEKQKWMTAVGGPPLPDWAGHYCNLLASKFTKLADMTQSKQLTINIWADCGGMGIEMTAGKQIAEAVASIVDLEIVFRLYQYCDKEPCCHLWAEAKHKPVHRSSNIFDRDFDTGEYYCTKCNEPHAMPQQGLDIYECCFPCGPWSKRGKGLGFTDADGNICFQAVKSIRYMQPALFFMENVTNIADDHGDGKNDLQEIEKYVKDELPNYSILTLKGVEPVMTGHPAHKPRLLILGARGDQASPIKMHSCFNMILANPMPVRFSYRQFLGFEDSSPIPWQRVGTLPSAQERMDIVRANCSCGVDPMVVCAVHACKCDKCKDSAEKDTCQWRQLAHCRLVKTFGENFRLHPSVKDKLTYVQVLEMYGHEAPAAPRERNLLNVVALFPSLQPLISTNAILDKSQSIDRMGLKVDGSVGTMATSAAMWSMRDGRTLTACQIAKLMGHKLDDIGVHFKLAETNLRKMLGMSLHVGTAGIAMTGLLASIGGDDEDD